MIYLDHSATTAPCDSAIRAVNAALTQNWGNPSSLYGFGFAAEEILNDARKTAANMLCCDKREIFFTSGGTEANNIAVFGAANANRRRGKRIVTTAVEHSSVYESISELEKEGFEVVRLAPDESGNISPEKIREAITADTVLVSLMLINNETGMIVPVKAAAEAVKAVGAPALIHCDAVQAFGKIPVSVKELGVDLLSASSHKIHGPKGCGILYKSRNARIIPRTYGGEQENRIRPGTEPVPAVAGFAAAMQTVNIPENIKKVESLNAYLRERVDKAGYPVNSPDNASPYILNFSVVGFRSETLLHALESDGIAVSSGSACEKGKTSHVLNALGISKDRVDSALRISLDPENTTDDIDAIMSALEKLKKGLVSSKR